MEVQCGAPIGLSSLEANKGTEEEEMMSLKLLITACLLNFGGGRAGYAPMEAPKLPAGFCPRETGSITETTGGEELCFVAVVELVSLFIRCQEGLAH